MLTLRNAAPLLLSAATLLPGAQALADELHYNQVSLRAEATQEVPRDLMLVTLYSEAQSNDPAKLAAQTTDTMNKALEQARQVKGVTVRLGNRNSYPIYEDKNQKITGWRERAELRLETQDFAALSKLTGELLGDLKMGSLDFSISPKSRTASEDGLIKDAVAAFKARAQLMTEALGGSGYKVVNLNLNTSGYPQPVFRPTMMMKSARMDSSAPAPTPEVEAGTTQITISAEGSIEVIMP